jgi:ubiquinone/menaquinone biosynthesis C-methylase UbiE
LTAVVVILTKTVWPSYLYDFLALIQSSTLEKRILDCGAGGPSPPLSLFAEYGFEAHGIDISPSQIEKAELYGKANDLILNLREGDMRSLPYSDESFSFVYTQNSLCHLTKEDARTSIAEMARVLKPDGYLMVDFMSVDCSFYGEDSLGVQINPGEFQYMDEEGEKVLHAFYKDEELDSLFHNLEFIKKVKVSTENRVGPRPSTDVRIYSHLRKSK